MLPGIGIFGCGQLVKLLVPCLRLKGFKVEAIWSFNDQQAESTAKELQIPLWTTEIDKVLLLPNVQLIVIACPPHLHDQITRHACGIGKHVLCDWPPATSNINMISMLNAALNYPTLITILCHSLRFLPAFIQMKSLISQGKIGQLQIVNVNVNGNNLEGIDRYSMKCDEMMGGGILANIGTHIIDIITFVTGLKANRVHGITRNNLHFKRNFNNQIQSEIWEINADDFACFQMELGNNKCLSNVTLNSHLFNDFSQEILVCGANGYLVVRGCDLFIKQINSKHEEILVRDADDICENNIPSASKLSLPYPYRKGLVKMISSLREAFNTSPQKSLTDTSQQNGEEKVFNWKKDAVSLAANFEDGRYIQAVIEAIRFSSKHKEWVRIKGDSN